MRFLAGLFRGAQRGEATGGVGSRLARRHRDSFIANARTGETWRLLIGCLLLSCSVWGAVPADHAARMESGLALFRSEIGSVLRDHCLECHGGKRVRGDLDLTTREGLLRGGSSGSVVVPFSASESRLLRLVGHEVEPFMPERRDPLPDAVRQSLARWIEWGAPYDAPLIEGKPPHQDRSVVTPEARQWWAFQPLTRVEPPDAADHPIDAFLRAAGREQGLDLNPPADRSTLLRRATLDLTGLPPRSDTVESFLRPGGADYAAQIDQLLDSPAYGERWARHWLDVARFAESSGFEHDYDRPHAFHYRDFVIRALNQDMPFNQFARWQLAGDEYAPEDVQAMMATGFLGAGVFPTQITANEVERTRYDAMDDMLATVGSAFLGLTVGCARCHDHKFDPIPERDYYRMLSTFTTTVRSLVDLELDPVAAKEQRLAHERQRAVLHQHLVDLETGPLTAKFDQWLAARPELPLNDWTLLEITNAESKAGAAFRRLEDGSYLVSGANGDRDAYVFTARTPLRGITAIKIDALTHPSAPQNGPGRAANGNFALGRIRVTAAPATGGSAVEMRLNQPRATHQQNEGSLSVASSLDDDARSGWAVDSGGIGKDQAAAFAFDQPVDLEGGAEFVVTLEFTVNTGHNLVRPRLSVSTIANPELGLEVVPPGIAALGQRLSRLNSDERRQVFEWWKAREPEWVAANARLIDHEGKRPTGKVPVMVCAEGFPPIVMHSQGPPFLEQTHRLKRGDPNQKLEVAEQGFLQVLSRGEDGERWKWAPPPGSKHSGRRRTLANWLTDVESGAGSLMARVTVNRLWQHHFGRGLVATPNDFGRTGVPPTNPGLLEWLAGELVRQDWRLKPMHRLIMSSAAYRQASGADPKKLAADPDNQLFLRFTPRRLESEALRDSMLAVAGLLDRTMFGPGTLDEASTRRSVYFTVKRSRLMTSMVVFDTPEPLTSQALRPVTTVAPQALWLMNNSQVRAWAEAFAQRLISTSNTADPAVWVRNAYLEALARLPVPAESEAAVAFIKAGYAKPGNVDASVARTIALTDFCQTLFALNEFAYVH
ncbi:MAG: PSD1 domain-containing protein [Verrucomicrobiales bacterium]|nr:PSD1 domain-containing protein [Verrucomicrobiales bacterium]